MATTINNKFLYVPQNGTLPSPTSDAAHSIDEKSAARFTDRPGGLRVWCRWRLGQRRNAPSSSAVTVADANAYADAYAHTDADADTNSDADTHSDADSDTDA